MISNSNDSFKRYLAEIDSAIRRGNATEHTHRPSLKALLEELNSSIHAVNEPKREKCGAPDYAILTNHTENPFTIGHIEAKNVEILLDEVEQSDQLDRYRKNLNNLILTNYLEFRWYVDGELRMSAKLGFKNKNGRIEIDENGSKLVDEMIETFLSRTPTPINTPEDLANRMARHTRMIRDIIIETYNLEEASILLTDVRNAFSSILIPEYKEPEKLADFANMYAQTIAYGLFAARCNHEEGKTFTRLEATAEIPMSNPFLRTFFEVVTGVEIEDEPYVGFVNDLVQLYSHVDIKDILRNFGEQGKKKDPIFHFYETFLEKYDPAEKTKRGVYFTPLPVVGYIVKSVESILKSNFDINEGLADNSKIVYNLPNLDIDKKNIKTKIPKVLILDPACGTGTFLYEIIEHTRNSFIKQQNAGLWSGFVRNQLLPRMFGFEIMMASHAIAHLKIGLQLSAVDMKKQKKEDWEFNFTKRDRIGIYLTNTLDEPNLEVKSLYGAFRAISEEAEAATNIKQHMPIMVIIGNPPYLGASHNESVNYQSFNVGMKYITGWTVGRNERALPITQIAKKQLDNKKQPNFIGQLIWDYQIIDGKKVNEPNLKWLQDDYVKFIRWSQWKIEKTGSGVIAFITAHGYLDNPTFRGMRYQLLRSFDKIYILDLHGNINKREVAPDGSKDEGVFDIKQGTAIGIFIKNTNSKKLAKVYHADLFGLRDNKDEYLSKKTIKTTKWATLEPHSPQYLFIPQDSKNETEFDGWDSVTDIFIKKSIGVVTARDSLAIHWSSDSIWSTVKKFIKLSPEEARINFDLGDDTRDWKVNLAQEDIRRSGVKKDLISKILYRPFDYRYTYYTGHSRGFLCMPRNGIMKHLLQGNNLALITSRMTKGETFKHAQVSRNPVEAICMSSKTSNNGHVFPLYFLPESGESYHPGSLKEVLFKEIIKNDEIPAKDKQPTILKSKALIDEYYPNESYEYLPNLNPLTIKNIEEMTNLKYSFNNTIYSKDSFTPLDLINYIYAILHSTGYRERYKEFLKRQFPNIPFTGNAALFKILSEIGGKIISNHLFENIPKETTKNVISYPIRGDDIVKNRFPIFKLGKTKKNIGRIYINNEQYFEGVPNNIWQYSVGGYQVCAKWLISRRNNKLTYEETNNFIDLIYVLENTIDLISKIDKSIKKNGDWPDAFK